MVIYCSQADCIQTRSFHGHNTTICNVTNLSFFQTAMNWIIMSCVLMFWTLPDLMVFGAGLWHLQLFSCSWTDTCLCLCFCIIIKPRTNYYSDCCSGSSQKSLIMKFQYTTVIETRPTCYKPQPLSQLCASNQFSISLVFKSLFN